MPDPAELFRDREDQMTEPSAASAKLIQYLNEAYGTEMRLETALQAHIAMASQPRYRKRLKEHLTETRRHAREVRQRIKRLGGTPETVSTPGPDVVADAAQALLGGAQKAVALAQGPLHAIRGTGEEEKQLKNAKSEYVSESEEIATYSAIETLAEALGDSETRQLARAIRRDEERMRAFLEKEIPRLTKAMAKAELPAVASRRSTTTRKAAEKATGRSAKTSAKPTPKRTSKAAAAKATPKRASKAAATTRKAALKGRASGKPAAARRTAKATATATAKR
jgi:ferritin-like metal-binding protein YciE